MHMCLQGEIRHRYELLLKRSPNVSNNLKVYFHSLGHYQPNNNPVLKLILVS